LKVYLVGGAVRDGLLGIEIKERDWVVVGETPESLLQQGYKPVGKDFPVFLHPETKEEYALARTERKTGKGYTGFICRADPSVTLEEDLLRRDLTINAMAKSPDGQLIDPYHGQDDLKNKLLRHVSLAFAEDPVRILRIARFAARFSEFKVAPETLELMKQMVKVGEVTELVPERVWKELSRALAEPAPQRFFEILKECKADRVIIPEITDLTHLVNSLKLTDVPHIRFAALVQSLSVDEVKTLCDRLNVPNQYRELALLVVNHRQHFIELRPAPEHILNLLMQLDCFRRPERLQEFIVACEANGQMEEAHAKTLFLMKALDAANEVDTQALVDQGLQGIAFGEELKRQRINAINKLFATSAGGGDFDEGEKIRHPY
jgi:tRNA nucleotidyltransferase (CCA-adding enzyme)